MINRKDSFDLLEFTARWFHVVLTTAILGRFYHLHFINVQTQVSER